MLTKTHDLFRIKQIDVLEPLLAFRKVKNDHKFYTSFLNEEPKFY